MCRLTGTLADSKTLSAWPIAGPGALTQPFLARPAFATPLTPDFLGGLYLHDYADE